jgi:tRNA(Ile)-lysidine synthase TilS/MesJ
VLTSLPKSGQYHCVVPIRGGKGSTYILYFIVRLLGLKPIAVTYYPGFRHELSVENARSACAILGIPLVEEKSPDDIETKMLRESLLMANKTVALWHQCGNCWVILRNMSINTAKTYGAPSVISGSSALESATKETYEN